MVPPAFIAANSVRSDLVFLDNGFRRFSYDPGYFLNPCENCLPSWATGLEFAGKCQLAPAAGSLGAGYWGPGQHNY